MIINILIGIFLFVSITMLLTLLIANLSLEISHTEEISIKQTSFLYKLMFRVELIYQYVEEFMFNIKHIKQFILNYKFRKEEFSHLYYIAEQNIEYTNICKLYWSYFIRPLFIPFSIIGITIFAIVTVVFLLFRYIWIKSGDMLFLPFEKLEKLLKKKENNTESSLKSLKEDIFWSLKKMYSKDNFNTVILILNDQIEMWESDSKFLNTYLNRKLSQKDKEFVIGSLIAYHSILNRHFRNIYTYLLKPYFGEGLDPIENIWKKKTSQKLLKENIKRKIEFLDLWVSILKEYKTIYLRKHKLAYFWGIKKKRLCPVIRVEVKENK